MIDALLFHGTYELETVSTRLLVMSAQGMESFPEPVSFSHNRLFHQIASQWHHFLACTVYLRI